jgi:hypothetical protein
VPRHAVACAPARRGLAGCFATLTRHATPIQSGLTEPAASDADLAACDYSSRLARDGLPFSLRYRAGQAVRMGAPHACPPPG